MNQDERLLGIRQTSAKYGSNNKCELIIIHLPIENRKASMDCLEGQLKVAENFKIALFRSMSHDWRSPSHCPSKQSMHALRSRVEND